MAVSIPEFWRLAAESQLLTPEQCQQLAAEFGQMKGVSPDSSLSVLIEWLAAKSAVSRYQATVLAAGRSGPFFYGDYKIYDREANPPLAGMFRAVHTPTSHPVMLQFLTGPALQDSREWSGVARRLKLECSIKHPNLHRCFEVVDLQSFKFLVIEDLRGQSIEQLIASGKRLPPQEACRIARCAALGLAKLHDSNLVHGDVRPHFFWMENGGNVKLIRDPVYGPYPVDLSEADSQGQMVSRADYLAPEFTQHGKTPDPLTDIYALGCSLYQLLAGRAPFPGNNVAQKMQQHASQPIQPLENMGVPQPIAQIVMYLMAKNPNVRYQSADQIAEQLAAHCDPNRLNVQPPAAKATLPAYERAIASRAAPVAPAGGASKVGAKTVSGFPTVTVSPATVGSTGGIVAVAKDKVTSSSAGGSVRQRYGKPKSEQDRIKKAGIALAAVGAVLIGALILINAMRGGPETASTENGDTTQQNGDTTGNGTSNDLADGAGGGSAVTPLPENGGSTVAPNGTSIGGAGAVQYVAVEDNGQLPWAPPTNGPPIDLSYLPPGSQIYMIARPADMLASSDGAKVLESLGPSFQQERAAWEAATGFMLADVEQLALSLHGGESDFPRAAMVVHLTGSMDKQSLLTRWGNPSPQQHGGQEYYAGRGGWSFYIPSQTGGKTFVMGSPEEIRSVIDAKGAAPLTRRAMSQLLDASDANRHFTLLFSPNELIVNLFRDGRNLSLCEPKKIREAIDWLLRDSVEAGLASVHFGGNTYAELMMVGRAGQIQKDALATELQQRLQQVPDQVEQYVISLDPHPYWKMIAFRFPSMIRYLHEQSRVGGEGDIAVINAILPSGAAHNLVFATEMALSSTPGVAPSAVIAASQPTGPKTLEEVLNAKTSITFAQDSLEFAMRIIEDEVKNSFPNLPFPFAIKIIGSDLEKNGITRNQQIRDFSEQGKTFAEILTSMVMKANPIKTVQAPHETDQQLIWVIGPDPDDASRQVVLITTRDAAAAKGYTLPPVFQPKA